jgi:hypothetical protein
MPPEQRFYVFYTIKGTNDTHTKKKHRPMGSLILVYCRPARTLGSNSKGGPPNVARV